MDTPDGPDFPEDAWIPSHLRIGEALFRVVLPTPRCVVPTLAQEELPPDPGIMRAVAREHRIPVFDLGRLSCVGVYLDVLEPGTVRSRSLRWGTWPAAVLGDPVTRLGSS